MGSANRQTTPRPPRRPFWATNIGIDVEFDLGLDFKFATESNVEFNVESDIDFACEFSDYFVMLLTNCWKPAENVSGIL